MIKKNKKLFLGLLVFLVIILLSVVFLVFNTRSRTEKNKNFDNLADLENFSGENYPAEVRQILHDYLVVRQQESFFEKGVCLQLATDTLNKILDLVVPLDKKEIHLDLVILLEKEKQNCENFSLTEFNKLGTNWEKIINHL